MRAGIYAVRRHDDPLCRVEPLRAERRLESVPACYRGEAKLKASAVRSRAAEAFRVLSLLSLCIVLFPTSASNAAPHTGPEPGIQSAIDGSAPSKRPSTMTAEIASGAPDEVVKLVFVHHSCGANWLSDWSGGLGEALGDSNYYVSDTSFGWGPPDADVGSGHVGDHTDIGHWYNWFAGPNRDTYLAELYTTDAQNATYTRPMADPGGENEVILLKSGYANSDLGGSAEDPPSSGQNLLRGVGAWSDHHTVANAKGIHNDILAYFQARQDKLFVVITAPPLLPSSTSEMAAANARALNDWLVHEWLADYPYRNVAVFDLYNVLTTNGGDPDTNDYGSITGNHHRAITSTTPILIQHKTHGDDDAAPNYLEYPTVGGTNDLPSTAGNQKAAGEFVPLLNAYYDCWKYGSCWEVAPSFRLAADSLEARTCIGGTAVYGLSATAGEGLTMPVVLTVEGAAAWMAPAFAPNPIDVPGTSELRLSTLAPGEEGTYSLQVIGSAGAIRDAAWITLTTVACPFRGFLPAVLR